MMKRAVVLIAALILSSAAGANLFLTMRAIPVGAGGAPVNVVLPAISGPAQVGQTLSATTGTWSNAPTSYTYQWRGNGTPIGGAVASTYIPVAGDIGNVITVAVTASNSDGPGSAAISAATVAVVAAGAVPVNTGLPVISGAAQVGVVLSTTNGTWTNTPTSYAYQWKSAGVNVGTSVSTYTPVVGDIGNVITVAVTATNGTGASAPATSLPTVAVVAAGAVPVNTAIPVISGAAQVGQTLTTTNGTWSNTPTSYAYQWKSAGSNVGTSIATYVPVVGDIGNTITCSVTATNGTGSSAPAMSAATVAVVAAPVPVNTMVPGISGSPAVGQTLTASNGTWTNSPTRFTYQWNGTSAAPSTVFSAALVANNTGNQGYQFREVIPASSLTASGIVSGSIRVGFGFMTGTTVGTMVAYIGEAAASGNPSDFDGTQVQLTFGGSTTLAGLNGASTVFSDYVPFTLDASKNLVISMFYGGTTVNVGEATAAPITVYYSNTVVNPAATVAAGLLTQAGFADTAGEVDFKAGTTGAIAGATASTYIPVTANVGDNLTVSVVAYNSSGGASSPATSAATAAVTAALPVPGNTAVPIIIGTAQVGQTLSTDNGSWTNSPTSFTWKWNRAGTPIAGATASTYVPVTADVGSQLTITVIAANSSGSSLPATSLPTSAVVAAASGPPVNTAIPLVSGSTTVGQTLTGTNGNWTNCPCSFTYTWNSAAATPDITAFNAAGNIVNGGISYAAENALQSWSLTESDTQTLAFQVRPGDVWSGDVGRAGPPNRSEIDGAANMFPPGTEVNISYNFDMTSATVRTDANGITIGQTHNDDGSLGGATSSPFEMDLQPLDNMSIYVANLASSPAPTNSTFYGNSVVNGKSLNYYQVYADPSPIVRNHNYTMKIQMKYTVGGDNSGFLNVWRDGVQIVNSTGQLGFGYNIYWKEGIYGTVTNATQIAQYQNLKVARRPLVLGTALTYIPITADAGNAVTLTVTATNSSGSASATSMATAAVVTGSGSPPANTIIPKVIGTAQVGQVLSTDNGSWTNSPTSYAWQWNSSGTGAIKGFSISGGKIIGPNGQPWIGRGIKISGDSLPSTLTALPAVTPLSTLFPGINVVMLYFTDNQFAGLQPYINALTAAGIVVVLQNDVESQFGLAQPIAPLTDGNLTTSVNFLANYATFYKNNPYVWFISENEPWLYAPNGTTYNLTPITQMQAAYYNGVRATGNNSIFVISTAGNNLNVIMTSFETTTFGAMSNVIWDTHFYNCTVNYDTTVAGNLAGIASLFNIYGVVNSTNGAIPVTLFEYGDWCGGAGLDAGWTEAVQAVNTAPNIQGSAAYTWYNGNAFDSLLNGQAANSGFTAFGSLVASYITAGPSHPTPPTKSGPITGATASTYPPVVGDVGSMLTVSVVASNGSGSSPAATSAATSAVIPAGTSGSAARTANLLGILGVSAHANDYAALNGATAASIVSDAQYLGITKWRDGLGTNAIYNALYNVGVTFIGLPWPVSDSVIADSITFADQVAAIGPGALFALEGPNEPAGFGFTYDGFGLSGGGSSWNGVAAWTSAWYTAVHADANLSGVPVWSASLIGAENGNYGMQYMTVPAGPPAGVLSAAGTKFADDYNMHLYPMFQGHAQTIDPSGDAIVGQLTGDLVTTYANSYAGLTLTAAKALTRGITEFGYQATGGTPSGTTTDIPTAAKDILNGVMNAWNEGYAAICIYTFYEDAADGGPGFGLLNSPGNPNARGTYMHNFTTPLKDAGANAKTFTTGSLSYTLTGLPSTGQALLFEKSNGHYEIIIWNNVSNWNFSAGTPIAVAPTNVTLTLGTAATTLNVYDPTVQATPCIIGSGTTITAGLADYPMILEVIP
jgi:hypothetical protein